MDGEDSHTVFKPSKRRKITRRRGDELDDDDKSVGARGALAQDDGREPNSPTSIIVENISQAGHGTMQDDGLIRARRRKQRRGGGIGFGGTGDEDTLPFQEGEEVPMQTEADLAAAQAADMGFRFARQSGFKVEVDKHMIAYVDAELARREIAAAGQSNSSIHPQTIGSQESPDSSENTRKLRSHEPSFATAKLEEVDVSSSALRPGTRSGTSGSSARTPHVRLGPDGKPWRGRNRAPRTSNDAARDAQVDALLSERVEAEHQHYRATPTATIVPESGARGGEGSEQPTQQTADERVAAEFVRQFREAAAERRVRREGKAAAKSGPGHGAASQKKTDPTQKLIANGPKLGGSRAQRAKMHALEAERLKSGSR